MMRDEDSDHDRFERIANDLLSRSGQLLDVEQAGVVLGIGTAEARTMISEGRILAVVKEKDAIVPGIQFVGVGGALTIVPGLDRILRVFGDTQAGSWSALQFLLERDPNLRCTPLEALRSGRVKDAENATCAYLDF